MHHRLTIINTRMVNVESLRHQLSTIAAAIVVIWITPPGLAVGQASAQTLVEVRKHGAIPDDGKDDAAAIQMALDQAAANGIRQVRFEAGTYDFTRLDGWEIAPDNSHYHRLYGKDGRYLTVADASGLELVGAVDAAGNPATRWIKRNDLLECQPMILSVEGGSDVTMRNISVDMAPYYYSAGKVLAVLGDEVEIEVLDGHPRIDGQRAFIMGTYDFGTRLAKVVRLTWDTNLPRWQAVGEPAQRRMRITHHGLAQACRPGEGVFWFQGNFCGPLLSFREIRGLKLENIRILGGHGFPLTCSGCRDVTYRNVRLAPEGNRIASSCRDGFKIHRAGGKVLMDGVVIDGCLGDDGQNIHGTWLIPAEKLSDKSVRATDLEGWKPLTPGAKVRLLEKDFNPLWEGEVESCGPMENKNIRITFKDLLPEEIRQDMILEPQEWLPDEVIIRNSTYRNTGRFGIYLKARNVLIEDTRFEGNAGALWIGGEWSPENNWLESTHPQNVTVRRCTFHHNRLDMRFSDSKYDTAITIAAFGNINLPGLMRNIRIHDNTFENEGTCLSAKNCDDVWFWNNRIQNCDKEMTVDPATALAVHRVAKVVQPAADQRKAAAGNPYAVRTQGAAGPACARPGGVFNTDPPAQESLRNFHERFTPDEKPIPGRVRESDFEPKPFE